MYLETNGAIISCLYLTKIMFCAIEQVHITNKQALQNWIFICKFLNDNLKCKYDIYMFIHIETENLTKI